ncbi:MAG TPA: DUF2017 family protein [Acidimicrobiales bacterium]|nr:DUF2017 family protein [Acidimicrobiales bacterium]
MAPKTRFGRDRHGRFQVRLSAQERELLAGLPSQVLELLAAEDPSTRRLFPTAYPDDPEAEREYRALVGESLLEHHRRALDALAEGATADVLEAGDLELWMGALEVLRLVLGTQLQVTEDMTDIDPDDPRAAGFALYAYLSMVQDELVDALASELPKGARG